MTVEIGGLVAAAEDEEDVAVVGVVVVPVVVVVVVCVEDGTVAPLRPSHRLADASGLKVRLGVCAMGAGLEPPDTGNSVGIFKASW